MLKKFIFSTYISRESKKDSREYILWNRKKIPQKYIVELIF